MDSETGHIVYSVFKEVDFATNLKSGPYKETNLAVAYQKVRETTELDFVKLIDFQRYTPSFGAPASFIGSPIFDGEKKIGVLLFQVPIDEIDRIMTGNRNWKKEGLGESGETYLVGSNHMMRSNSRFLIEKPTKYFELLQQQGTPGKKTAEKIRKLSTSVLFQNARTEATVNALQGNAGTTIINNYSGIPVLSSYAPLNIQDVKWVILSEMNVDEAFAPLKALEDKILWIAVFISFFVICFAYLISKTFSTPILQLIKGIEGFGKGDLPKKVHVSSTYEMGVLATTFNQMAENLHQATLSKKYVDNVLASMAEILVVASPAINKSGAVITKVNNSATAALGYAEKELLGEPLEKIFLKEEQLEEELIQKGFIHGAEKTYVAKKREKNTGMVFRFRDVK